MSALNLRSCTQVSAVVPAAILEPANFLLIVGIQLGVGGGNFANVTLSLQEDGHSEIFSGVGVGLRIGRVKGWNQAIFSAPVNTVINFIYGNESHREDLTEFNAITTQIQPSSTFINDSPNGLATGSPIALLTGGNSIVHTSNTGRRRITISSIPTNTGFIFVAGGNTSAANTGVPIAPGQSVEFDTVAQLSVINNSGATQTFSTSEEF